MKKFGIIGIIFVVVILLLLAPRTVNSLLIEPRTEEAAEKMASHIIDFRNENDRYPQSLSEIKNLPFEYRCEDRSETEVSNCGGRYLVRNLDGSFIDRELWSSVIIASTTPLLPSDDGYDFAEETNNNDVLLKVSMNVGDYREKHVWCQLNFTEEGSIKSLYTPRGGSSTGGYTNESNVRRAVQQVCRVPNDTPQ